MLRVINHNLVKAIQNRDFKKTVHILNNDIMASGDDAMQVAIIEGWLDLIKYLERNGVVWHLNSKFAMRKSVEKGHIHVIKHLISQGVSTKGVDISTVFK